MVRKFRFIFSFIVFSIIIVASNIYGENIPSLKEVELIAVVQFDSRTGIYTYNYQISNSLNNTGDIARFEIDISKPANGIALKKEGLINGKGYLSSEDILSTYGLEMIPVGFQSAPSDWISGPTVRKTADWGGGDESLIKTGQSLDGFVLTSYGIPAIREFKVEPWIDVDTLYPNIDELESKEEADAVIAKIKTDREHAIYKGKIIGPTAPPADFKPLDFLSYIISLKHEAYNLGWIIQGKDDDKGKKDDEEKGIMKSLDEKLDKAKKKLEKGDTKEAIEKLKSFIHEVEALYKEKKEDEHGEKDKKDKDKEKEAHRHEHITSEAYALLKYNTEYLIEKLGGEKEGKKDKKKET